SGERRMELSAGISYVDDLDKVQQVAVEAIGALPFIREGKPVEVYFRGFTLDMIQFYVWFWIDPLEATPGFAVSEAVKALKKSFDQNDILLVFAPYTLDLKQRIQPGPAEATDIPTPPVSH
ncbi:MAG: mechanosensitive ion channel family protein, partial [Bacteroidetes bacterium]|nr:mechanosensitive ion channel family protein [Fibrella sp.]